MRPKSRRCAACGKRMLGADAGVGRCFLHRRDDDVRVYPTGACTPHNPEVAVFTCSQTDC
eukprot:scaffold1638_cov258-Pinguiococcus_pyrenoidosus.AAC.70